MGEAQPANLQRILTKAKIKPGCIIHIYCDFVTPPHNKFIVITHVDYDDDLVLFFLVNSNIPKFILNNPALKSCQIDMLQADYTFLDHDSHLDGSKIFDNFTVEDIVSHLLNRPNNLNGNLFDKEIFEIIQAVVNANTISDCDKGLIINSLGN